jgi:hypothetical protein
LRQHKVGVVRQGGQVGAFKGDDHLVGLRHERGAVEPVRCDLQRQGLAVGLEGPDALGERSVLARVGEVGEIHHRRGGRRRRRRRGDLGGAEAVDPIVSCVDRDHVSGAVLDPAAAEQDGP